MEKTVEQVKAELADWFFGPFDENNPQESYTDEELLEMGILEEEIADYRASLAQSRAEIFASMINQATWGLPTGPELEIREKIELFRSL